MIVAMGSVPAPWGTVIVVGLVVLVLVWLFGGRRGR